MYVSTHPPCEQLCHLVLLARQCVFGTHTTAQLLHTVRQLAHDADMGAVLAVAAIGGKEHGKTQDFNSRKYVLCELLMHVDLHDNCM